MRVVAYTRLPVPPSEAWDRLLRWEEQARWMKDAAWVRVLTPQREGVGVRIAVRTRVFGVSLFTEVLEVVEWKPPSVLKLRHAGLVEGFGTWELRAAPGGSMFRWAEDITLPVPLIGEAALFVYRPFMRTLMAGALRRFRELVASAGDPPAH